MKYCLLGYNRKMLDGVLENLVFLEMKRRGYQVYIGKMLQKKLISLLSGRMRRFMFWSVSGYRRTQTGKSAT